MSENREEKEEAREKETKEKEEKGRLYGEKEGIFQEALDGPVEEIRQVKELA